MGNCCAAPANLELRRGDKSLSKYDLQRSHKQSSDPMITNMADFDQEDHAYDLEKDQDPMSIMTSPTNESTFYGEIEENLDAQTAESPAKITSQQAQKSVPMSDEPTKKSDVIELEIFQNDSDQLGNQKEKEPADRIVIDKAESPEVHDNATETQDVIDTPTESEIMYNAEKSAAAEEAEQVEQQQEEAQDQEHQGDEKPIADKDDTNPQPPLSDELGGDKILDE